MDTSSLHSVLLEQFKKSVDDWLDMPYCRADMNPPTGQTTASFIGPWLWVRAVLKCDGHFWSPSTDSEQDAEEDHGSELNWIGPAATAPTRVSGPEELDRWALLKTTCISHNLRKEGRTVQRLDENGAVDVLVFTNAYPNVGIMTEREHLRE